ncbi:MAG: hypothetical protein COB36_11860 [Alphaproteobacteria bacterium]|nr:MAG: hypothetical protein COB36_11860 [Alphaproteobacteria bacterium]
MYNSNINIYRAFRVCFFAFLIGVLLFPFLVNAKTAKKTDTAGADLEKLIYSDDKEGCEKKAGMFVFFSKKYKAGEKSEGYFQFRMLDPLSEMIYARIREKGIEKASIDNMKEYSACIKSAGVYKNPKKERDLTLKHTACAALNDIILETIAGIKKRKKPESLMAKYEHKRIDMTWTNYADIPDMGLYTIAMLYKMAKTEKYENVVLAASNMSATCYMLR